MSAVLRAGDLPARLDVGEASIEVSFDSDPFDLGQAALLDWVMQSARAATAYFGRFPVTHARVHLVLSRGGRISTGVSFRDGGARCRITVGQHVTLADLDDDVTMLHWHWFVPAVFVTPVVFPISAIPLRWRWVVRSRSTPSRAAAAGSCSCCRRRSAQPASR